jgi:predicted HTH domain antitoxin
MQTISIRINKELQQKLEFLLRTKHIEDRSTYLRTLIDRAMTEDLIEYALNEFKSRRISLWKAASITGMSLQEFMDEAKAHSVPTIDESTIRDDIRWVREKM